jgi:hypothetical protein
MKAQKLLPDKEWNHLYIEKPENEQKCMSKIKGEEGHVSECIYKDGYFETYKDERNRFVITRWKHDLWLPAY